MIGRRQGSRLLPATILCAAAWLTSGCATEGAARLREYGPLVRKYEAMRRACDPDGGDSTVKKTGCPVCVY